MYAFIENKSIIFQNYENLHIYLFEISCKLIDSVFLFSGLVGDLGMKMMHQHTLFNQRPPEPVSEVTVRTNKVYCSQLAERISQDNCITAGMLKRYVLL